MRDGVGVLELMYGMLWKTRTLEVESCISASSKVSPPGTDAFVFFRLFDVLGPFSDSGER